MYASVDEPNNKMSFTFLVVHLCGLNMLLEIQRILSLFLLKQLQQRDQPSLIHSSRCNRIIENGCNALYSLCLPHHVIIGVLPLCLYGTHNALSSSTNDPRYFYFWCSLNFGKIRKIFEPVNSFRTTSSY